VDAAFCPADGIQADEVEGAEGAVGASESLFALREDVGPDHPIVGRYLEFARRQGLEIAGFEFIETADGRLVTYDVNTNTNYNPQVEAVAPRSGPGSVARYLKGLLTAQGAR
jgi:hypothetical protein